MTSRRSGLRAFRHDRPRPLVFDPHLHSEHEFVLIDSGRGVAYARDEAMPFEAGDLLAFAGSVPHTVVTEPGTVESATVVVHIETRAETALCSSLFTSSRRAVRFRPCTDEMRARVKTLMHGLLPVANAPVARQQFAELCEDLSSLSEDRIARSTWKMGAASPAMQRVLERIEQDPRAAPTLEELAVVAGMRVDSLCRAFRRCFDRTISDYRNELRVEGCATALATSDSSILSIAIDAGYENLSYFNRRFRRRYGVTPREYRRAQRVSDSA